MFDRVTFRRRNAQIAYDSALLAAFVASAGWELGDPRYGSLFSVFMGFLGVFVIWLGAERVTRNLTLTMDGIRLSSLLGSRDLSWEDVARVEVPPATNVRGVATVEAPDFLPTIVFLSVAWNFQDRFANFPVSFVRGLLFNFWMLAALFFLWPLLAPSWRRLRSHPKPRLGRVRCFDLEGTVLLEAPIELSSAEIAQLQDCLLQASVAFDFAPPLPDTVVENDA